MGGGLAGDEVRTRNMFSKLLWVPIVAILLTQLGQRWWVPDGSRFNLVHICLAGAIVAIHYLEQKRGIARWIVGLPALGIIGLNLWHYYPVPDISRRMVYVDPLDVAVGMLLILFAVFFVFRAFGPIFGSLGIVAIAYAFLGSHVPEPLTGPPIAFRRVIARLAMGSIYTSALMNIWAHFIWLLLVWGMLIEVAGAGRVVAHLARIFGARFRVGPALITVLTSSAVGSFTGAGGNNVAVTGSVTIPMMKRAGYSPEQAAAIESAASVTSGITPPVMGAVAFIMAQVLQIPYSQILIMVLIPMAICYVTITVYVAASAQRQPLQVIAPDQTSAESTGLAIRSALIAILPVTTFLILVLRHFSMYSSVFWSFVALAVAAVVLRVERRPSVIAGGIVRAVVMASSVTMAIMTISLLTDVLAFTALQPRLGAVIFDLSNGNFIAALIMMTLAGVILGAGLPEIVVYYLMFITFVPVFIQLDINPIAAHFIAFYMGILGGVSPPLAPTVLIASGIAGSSYLRTGLATMRIVFPWFFLPLVIALAPELLLGVGSHTASDRALAILSVLAGVCMLVVASAGWLGVSLKPVVRLALVSIFGVLLLGLAWESDAIMLAVLAASVISVLLGFVARWRRQRLLHTGAVH